MSDDSDKAYISGFEFDIFISYAHVDNQTGWVERFHEALEIKLAQRFGRAGMFRIWRDKSLTAEMLFDDVIKYRITRSLTAADDSCAGAGGKVDRLSVKRAAIATRVRPPLNLPLAKEETLAS